MELVEHQDRATVEEGRRLGAALGTGDREPKQAVETFWSAHDDVRSLTHWERVQRRNREMWRLNCYNDIAHLQGIGAFESLRWEDTGLAPADDTTHPAAPVPTEE